MIILSNTTIHIESEEAMQFENYPYNINRKFGEITYQVNLSVKRQKKPDRYVYQYKKGNIENVKKDMEDLCTIFESENRREKSIDENWTLFKKTLLKSMEKNIPTKKITSRWNLPWITPDTRRLCQQKKRAWDSGKHNRNSLL
jgi:hypothetical protein